ncbi:hypothetical protein OPV22_035215 [Ensete ventricosum]|uniref:Uncharacterized protein n=1 Tax=Ensete ventricosum TaxID=4639 RepID=A0AAX5JZH1_ENSVE|nr:hypothetical protein OPV22_035215 [Ensete ventricosum]
MVRDPELYQERDQGMRQAAQGKASSVPYLVIVSYPYTVSAQEKEQLEDFVVAVKNLDPADADYRVDFPVYAFDSSSELNT